MMVNSHSLPLPPSVPDKAYNFTHTIVQTVPVSASIVMWNLIDFAHVNWVHRKTYKYCKLLAKTGSVYLMEYGVKQFFPLRLSFSFSTLMWHEYISPFKIQHLSCTPWGTYNRVEVHLEEFEERGQTHTRLTHIYHMALPKLLYPLKGFLRRYIEWWSEILWSEDSPMLIRRQRVLEAGFHDHPLDLIPRGREGLVSNDKQRKSSGPFVSALREKSDSEFSHCTTPS